MKQLITFILGTSATVVLVNQGIDLLNQPSTIAVTVGVCMICVALAVVVVVGNYVVKSILKATNDHDETNSDHGRDA